MRVRPATAHDVPQLCELLALLFTQEAEFVPDAVKQARGLQAILADDNAGRILVLEDGGKILGMVSLLFTVSTYLGARVALLEDMVVDPNQRSRGHGGQLLQAAIAEAKTAGCRRITLLTDSINTEAKAFYQRAGFAESSMTPLRLLLDF
jgi:N-acetylglutamate synthase-like GNAT family acetyltransferase